MAGGLTLPIVWTAAGVVGPALGIYLWVWRGRRSRLAATARNHRDRGGVGGELVHTPPDPCGTTDPAQEAANLVPLGKRTERSGRSVPDEISDLAKFASDAARSGAEAGAAAPTLEIATEADREHDLEIVAPTSARETEFVSCGVDIPGGGTRVPPPEDAVPPLCPACAAEAAVSAGLGPLLAEAPSPSVAGPVEIALEEAQHEVAAACFSEDAEPRGFAHLDEVLAAEACGGVPAEGNQSAETAEAAGGEERSAAESTLRVGDGPVIVAPPVDNPNPAPELVTRRTSAPDDPVAEDSAGDAGNAGEPVWTRPRTSKPARHRDRRGQRRALPLQPAPSSERPPPVRAALRAPAEAKLRLMFHPIRRAAVLSAVLARPAGYPDRITLALGEGTEISAYSEDRYDDVDLEWTADLLSREIRLDCEEGYQWLRSGRRIHIFCAVADEPGLVSVGSAALTLPSTIICLREDADAVRLAAEACGSQPLVSHDHWTGIPDGWVILSGYLSTHGAASGLIPGLTGLDPGVGSEIRFSGGLRLRPTAFAEGSPPKIEILPFPSGATITIDGQPAQLGEDGAWRAGGWDMPGDHLVDVVPGPSSTYRIMEDPWSNDGWETWDAHPERFSVLAHAPWAVAQICGAGVSGPGGEYVVVAEAMPSVVCLGLRRGAVALRARPDAPVAVGLLSETPAFLISASGPRRRQGRIAWLDPAAPSPLTREIDPGWVAAVRSASSRRLPLEDGSIAAKDAWRRARERARRHRRRRS
jgi:hypothetical protein